MHNFSPTPIEIVHDDHQVVENDEQDQVEIDIGSKTVFDTIDLDFEISPKNRDHDEDSGASNDVFESSGDF